MVIVRYFSIWLIGVSPKRIGRYTSHSTIMCPPPPPLLQTSRPVAWIPRPAEQRMRELVSDHISSFLFRLMNRYGPVGEQRMM